MDMFCPCGERMPDIKTLVLHQKHCLTALGVST